MSTLADMSVFPVPVAQPFGDGYLAVGGISLRQHYAGLAMQGLLSNPMYVGELVNDVVKKFGPAWLEKFAALHADALIAELEKAKAPA